jgi:GxxExxY protein
MTNYKVDTKKVLFAQESFEISGVCFYVHNKLGRFAKEKQYSDLIATKLEESGTKHVREFNVGNTGNRVDFVIFDKILLEIKAKPFLNQNDFDQVQRYLHILDLELGLLVNFHARSAQPKRILRKRNNFNDS